MLFSKYEIARLFCILFISYMGNSVSTIFNWSDYIMRIVFKIHMDTSVSTCTYYILTMLYCMFLLYVFGSQETWYYTFLASTATYNSILSWHLGIYLVILLFFFSKNGASDWKSSKDKNRSVGKGDICSKDNLLPTTDTLSRINICTTLEIYTT